MTVGLDNTSQLAGASQLPSVLLLLQFCTPSNSAWFLLLKNRHEVGFDLGHLLTATISVSELGKCRIWLWLEVGRPDFGTWLFLEPLRFLLFTQSRHSSFCPDCYGGVHWAFSRAILLRDQIILFMFLFLSRCQQLAAHLWVPAAQCHPWLPQARHGCDGAIL